MSSFFLSEIAEQDIDDIVTYIAQDSSKAAMKLLDSLYNAMDNLVTNPMLGHTREDLTNKPVRFLTFKWHYLIIYKPSNPVEIVRVLSGYRDISSILM
ncbi:MAG: type II toxin-antitoxin system RelE/ParE family toxin [Gammaproteobacteria bacterium]|nr:MAG: type II toxin-antitoxin system RelE/ParE family toxin [Gammaproteobacteria bacterium]